MKHKILVVVDAQNDFIDGSLLNAEAQERVPNIVEWINKFDGDYIFATMDTHGNRGKNAYKNTKEGKKLPIPHCIAGTHGWEMNELIEKAIKNKLSDGPCEFFTIAKKTFGSEVLASVIKSIEGDLEIEIVGFCTDICVISNALLIKAAVYDRADISVIEKCCAGVTPATHKSACDVMKSCQIDIV